MHIKNCQLGKEVQSECIWSSQLMQLLGLINARSASEKFELVLAILFGLVFRDTGRQAFAQLFSVDCPLLPTQSVLLLFVSSGKVSRLVT